MSRPLLALLVATVAFFALWLVALKPGGSGSGANSSTNKGLGQYQADINAAHGAVSTANTASARAGGTASPAPVTTTATPAVKAPARHVTATATAVRPTAKSAPGKPTTASGATRLAAVQHALRSHKVLALLFYNPAAADDRAVNQELGTIQSHRGRVFKLAIPLNEIIAYTGITNRVPVNFSPTLVLVAPNGQADEIVGYTDAFEISQRVDDALAVHR